MTSYLCQPDSIPSAILSRSDLCAALSWNQLCVAHSAGRIDFEEVAAALVIKRIEREHETIVGIQLAVANHLVGEHAIGVGIEKFSTDVKMVVIENDADFRTLSRRVAIPRVRLFEARRRFST